MREAKNRDNTVQDYLIHLFLNTVGVFTKLITT